MLKRMTLVAGTTPNQPSLEVDLSSVTVFVGPNNSGKSRALQEIESWMRHAQPPKGLVVKSIEFEAWEQKAIESEIEALEVEPDLNESLQPDHILVSKLNPQNNASIRTQIHKSALVQQAQNPNGNRNRYATVLPLLRFLWVEGCPRPVEPLSWTH